MSEFDDTRIWVLFGVYIHENTHIANSYVIGIFKTRSSAEFQKITHVRHDTSNTAYNNYYIKEARLGEIYDYHWNNTGEIP